MRNFLCTAALVAVASSAAPPVPPINNTCLAGCVKKGDFIDVAELCTYGARNYLTTCASQVCHTEWKKVKAEFESICTYIAEPTTPSPRPTPFPWTFKNKCFEQCVNEGPWEDARGLCAPGASVSLSACRVNKCLQVPRDVFFSEYGAICDAWRHSTTMTPPPSTTSPTPTSTNTCRPDQIVDYRGFCRCPDGYTTDYRGFCRTSTPTVSCNPPMTVYYGSCKCPGDMQSDYRGGCRCLPGSTADSAGWCHPEKTTTLNSTTPVTTPPTTSPSPITTPSCPSGFMMDHKGKCVSIPPTPTPTPTPIPCKWDHQKCWCPSGHHHDYRGWCRPDNCKPGHHWHNGTCIVTPTTSPSPTGPTCPTGTRPDENGNCTPLVPTPPSTLVCPPGSQLGPDGKCHPFLPPTSTPPFPCHNRTGCTPRPPHPPKPTGTEVTKTVTVTDIETLTWCPPRCRPCHGQTTTWTYTFGPTSCPPIRTCTCVLPGKPTGEPEYPTLPTCPPSVTCTGQTTTVPEEETVVLPGTTVTEGGETYTIPETTVNPGETVVLPSETLPTNVPVEPTASPTGPEEYQGEAPSGGVEIFGVFIAAVLGSIPFLVAL